MSYANCQHCLDQEGGCAWCNPEEWSVDFDPNIAFVGHFTPSIDVQVDGDHYKNLAIQPAVYSYKNNLNWHQGEIIKYVTRYKDKNGKVDLEKARHLIDMLIELEYDSP